MVHLDQPVVPGTWLLKSREMLVAWQGRPKGVDCRE